MGLISKINKVFNVRISLSQLFKSSTIKKQAEFVDKANKEDVAVIPKAALADYYALSSAQKRLHFLYEFDKTSLVYNMPQVVRLEGELDKDRLQEAINKLVERHESLRTSL